MNSFFEHVETSHGGGRPGKWGGPTRRGRKEKKEETNWHRERGETEIESIPIPFPHSLLNMWETATHRESLGTESPSTPGRRKRKSSWKEKKNAVVAGWRPEWGRPRIKEREKNIRPLTRRRRHILEGLNTITYHKLKTSHGFSLSSKINELSLSILAKDPIRKLITQRCWPARRPLHKHIPSPSERTEHTRRKERQEPGLC